MTVAFSDPTAAAYAPWSTVERNELQLAWSERRQAIGQSAQSALTTSTNPLDTTWWATLQTWLQDECVQFVDHNQTIAGETAVPMFTLSSWRTAAGLNSSGFRRVTSWSGSGAPTFSYGLAQDGDIDGYWLYEDIIAALSTLKWTVEDGTDINPTDPLRFIGALASAATCAQAVSDHDSAWDTYRQSEPSVGAYYIGGVIREWEPDDIMCETWRFRMQIGVDAPFFGRDRVNDLYAMGSASGIDTWGSPDYPTIQPGILTQIASDISASNMWLGNIDTNPRSALSVDCSHTEDLRGAKVYPADCKWILKWDFTNA